MRSTGWQPHTVRGVFAAAVRKKLGLKLESEKADGERVYRIVAGKTSADTADAPNFWTLARRIWINKGAINTGA
jgi:hypothetical protein